MSDMHGRKPALALAALLICLPGLAGAWRAWNWHEVYAVDQSVFEVIGRAGSGPAQYWCGAGDYARSALGVEATRKVYMWRGIGPSVTRPGRRAVQFAFSPPPGTEDFVPGYSLSIRQAGDHMNAAAAQQYCRDLKLFEF